MIKEPEVEHTEYKYLVITNDSIFYEKTANEAVIAAGVPTWWSALPTLAVQAMEPGDEMSVGKHNSIFRITGKDTTLTW